MKLLPTMAISVIKKDSLGNAHRAKYRIVVLGNTEQHAWDKSECFAPVLAQHDLRLLLNLAVHKRCTPKSGDVSQAFCQSYLPSNEVYVCRPPPGCPETPPNSYWQLLKTLYGLRRSPRHWYEMAHKILTSIGLKRSPNSPCLYSGNILQGQPPLYLGLYVDDFIFFSESSTVETHFQTEFQKHVSKVTFSPDVDFFLGLKFDTIQHANKDVTIHLSQTAFIENLLHQFNMDTDDINTVQNPYRSGLPIDSIPNEAYTDEIQQSYTKKMQSLVGSLTWLSISTRPDISTITNLLAKYVRQPSKGHLDAAKRVLRYLKGTKHKGIKFETSPQRQIEAFLKFPLQPKQVTALTDANWGSQDQSIPNAKNPSIPLDLFKTRSLSGFILWSHGPIHWISKRQTLTARSSAEAEIVTTDECTKFLLYLKNVCDDINVSNIFFPTTTTVYNDNAACIKWSKNMTTRGLRYIQIRENAVREAVQSKFIELKHIDGKINPADLFTKEDRDTAHFLAIRDILIHDVPTTLSVSESLPVSKGGVNIKS